MGRIKPVDIEYMRTIHDLVNIIPVIIQPDLALRPEFITQQRLDVLHVLSTNEIKFSTLGYEASKQPPFMLDWSSTKRTFHGLLPLKQALYQHATNSVYLKQDTTCKFIQWRSTISSSNSSSSISSFISNSTCSESIQQNIRISQYVSERRHSMEKELLRLRKEFESASKHKKTELILKEINALVMDNKQDVLIQSLLNHSDSTTSSSNRSQIAWISLSFTLFIIICYLHFWNNNNNNNSSRQLPFD
jgi:septin family protein